MGIIIGIDIGTTIKCVAVMEVVKPTVIANAEGKRTTTTIIEFTNTRYRELGKPNKINDV